MVLYVRTARIEVGMAGSLCGGRGWTASMRPFAGWRVNVTVTTNKLQHLTSWTLSMTSISTIDSGTSHLVTSAVLREGFAVCNMCLHEDNNCTSIVVTTSKKKSQTMNVCSFCSQSKLARLKRAGTNR